MITTFTEYADFVKFLRSAYQTVFPTVYYFDDTGGSGNFYIWAVYLAGGDGHQIVVVGKPATFAKDFPYAVQLTSVMALS